jgi:hypothetical protein
MIEIVIKIPKEDWKFIKESDGCRFSRTIIDAVINGTPLPKGHGRIIDTDDIALIDEQFYVPSDYYVAESAIDHASTIIGADKEE